MHISMILPLLLTGLGQVNAGYNSQAKTNLAVYWGQNSWGGQHLGEKSKWQKRLSEYCSDTNIDIFNIAFATDLDKMTPNVANADLRLVGEDIKKCQDQGKTILLSIGGAQGTTPPRFSDENAAKTNAETVWEKFGPATGTDSSVDRPFGNSSVDGFDLDIEGEQWPYMKEWAKAMKTNMGPGKYLSAAPECNSPASGPLKLLLEEEKLFDFVYVMFYNNEECWNGNIMNTTGWEDWAEAKNTRFFVGLLAGESGGNGYRDDMTLFDGPKKQSRFAGAMLWDMSQAENNDDFHHKVKFALW